MVQLRTPLRGSPRLWSGIAIGICCGIVGAVLEWQQQKFLNELGTGIIGFGLAWIVGALNNARHYQDSSSK